MLTSEAGVGGGCCAASAFMMPLVEEVLALDLLTLQEHTGRAGDRFTPESQRLPLPARPHVLKGAAMHNIPWSPAEKKLARALFDAALAAELAELVAEVKRRAAQAQEPSDLWRLEEYLGRQRRHIDAKYDYRYSQLIHVFGQLLREGRISAADLEGLADDKLGLILAYASL